MTLLSSAKESTTLANLIGGQKKLPLWKQIFNIASLPAWYGIIDIQLLGLVALEQWFPNFFGPPPPWFHIHTHSAPLLFFKKHKCAFVSTFILYLKIV
jgi:hypothetical protein